MKHAVFLVSDAEEDIFSIYSYVAAHDSPQRAQILFDRLHEICGSLSDHPERGHVPPELDQISVKTFLEVHFKPYRIIFQIVEKSVFIHCVLDGRRDLQDLLQQRLLR